MPLSNPTPQTFGGPRDDGVSNPPWSHLLEPACIAVTQLVDPGSRIGSAGREGVGIGTKQADTVIRLVVYMIWYNI